MRFRSHIVPHPGPNGEGVPTFFPMGEPPSFPMGDGTSSFLMGLGPPIGTRWGPPSRQLVLAPREWMALGQIMPRAVGLLRLPTGGLSCLLLTLIENFSFLLLPKRKMIGQKRTKG